MSPHETASGESIWSGLETARSLIMEALSQQGVVGVEFVVGFGETALAAVWLCTATDGQRDDLSDGVPIEDPDVARQRPAARAPVTSVRAALLQSGFTKADLDALRGVVVQSQETVDRDFEGSWFYALR